MEGLISTLVWAAIIQGVFLAGLYLFSKKHRSFANTLLGLFLAVIVYEGTLAFLPFNDIFGYSLYYFSLPEVKLFYPLLFLHYILEKIGRSKGYRKFLRLNYVLAYAIAGVSVINILLFVFKGHKIEDYVSESTFEFLFMSQQYYAFILVLVVLVIALIEVKHYRMVVQKEYSDYGMLNITWLWGFIFVIIPIIVVWGSNLLWIIIGGRNNPDLELATWGGVVILIYFVSFQAFRHKNLFEGVVGGPEEAVENGLKKAKEKPEVEYPIIGQREDEELIQQIEQHMETQEPYLDASLSIHQLSQQLHIPVRELSLLINHRLNKHFFDFVNEYRIKKAMKMLSDPENGKMTVLEILYEVGFNSKSSFNTVFKKYTGKTPTQYRNTASLPAD